MHAGQGSGMPVGLALLLLLLLATSGSASILPSGGPGVVQPTSSGVTAAGVAAQNAAIATRAEAAAAAGQPAKWLVSFRVPEEQVTQQTQVISTSAGIAVPPARAASVARQQVYAAVKTSVLGSTAVTPTAASSAVTTEAGAASTPALQVLGDYSHLPITYVSISSAAELVRLRANPAVASVRPNGVVRTMAMNGLAMIGQPAVLERGFVGGGTVMTVDTGLDYTQDVFGPCTAPGVPAATCKVLFMKDFATDDGVMDDGEFHGTNVAGIIATVAPGVRLINGDVFGPDGSGDWNDLIAAVNWAVANKDTYNITTINLSLGGDDTTGACDDNPLAVAINSAYAQGIMSAAAAGNEASSTSLIVPACASKAVSVGAVHPVTSQPMAYTVCTDTSTPQPDDVACFSNSDSMLTMLAPGVGITAAGVTMSGTSQATPFVAASLALLRNRFPAYTLPQIQSALTSTGVPVTDKRNGLTKPRLNLRAAMSISCTPKITPTSVKASSTGGTYTLTVTPPTPDCTWTVAAPTASWMRLVGTTTGTGPGTVTVQVDPAATVARSTGVSVAAVDGSAGWNMLLSQPIASANAADSRPPIMGRLQATSAGGAVTLTWPAAQDAQSGVSSYRVVYNEGTKPPTPRCTTGTPINQQPTGTGPYKLTVSGLTAGARYTFRVCAIDSAGNVALGSMWRGSASRR